MTGSRTQEPGWQDDERGYEKLRAIREATQGCPCEKCAGQQACKTTGHECAGFLRWCTTGSTREVK